MEQRYRWPWVEAQVEQSIERWKLCALPSIPHSTRFSIKEQRVHEKAYDEACVPSSARPGAHHATERTAFRRSSE